MTQATDPVATLFAELRAREKAQTVFYRSLAAEAELTGADVDAERLNGLHADEQHHLSRLSARLLELGVDLVDLSNVPRPVVRLEGWEDVARKRESEEVAAYEAALQQVGDDPVATAILEEILESERHHLRDLGGKWMPA